MITVKLRYSTGEILIKQFKTQQEAIFFINGEGDRLVEADFV